MEITARQLPTHYERIGRGPTLVMLHGWGCDWQIFSPIIPTLSDHFQLIIPDLPAFGTSHTPSEVWGTPEYVEWLSDFIQQTVGGKRFSLLGHSYGGRLAAYYTAAAAGSIPSQLLLCDASGIPTELSVPQRVQQHFLTLIPRQVKDKLTRQLRQQLLSLTRSSSDHFLANEAQKKILRQVIKDDIRPVLSQIHVPTLLLWGEQDPDTTLSHARQFEQLIIGSELVTFPNVGHFPFIEQPDRFIREVLSFTQV